MSDRDVLLRRLDDVRARVAAAAARSGRSADSVVVVAVTKTVGAGVAEVLADLGHRDFGENRPADLVAKRAALAAVRGRTGAPVRWHLIGHFQRNKVRRTIASVDLLHSLDSVELAETVSAEAVRAGGQAVRALVQVNVSGEGTKGGFAPAPGPDGLEEALARLRGLPALELHGLMTMAPQVSDPEEVRPVFRRLRELRDWARGSGYLAGSELSMGMSEDFDVAVEEGATIVRVGRALVGVPLV